MGIPGAGWVAGREAVTSTKPRLRGWLHLGTAPLAGVGTIWLAAHAAPAGLLWPALVFAVTSILLFGTSALYHRGHFSPRVTARLQRWDHANIFLVIAGSATPFAVGLLPPGSARVLLAVLWVGALTGVLLRVAWARAPRWLFVPLYLALGWVSATYLPAFVNSTDVSPRTAALVIGLILLGGLLYTLGAGVFALRWPDPSPRWFGFHEVFHCFTIGGWASHFAAAAVVVFALR
ncbi:MAG: PAQR family membrane homeostasis protein TrhA [Candidatus Nanopelagicales bacterium]